MFISGTGWIHLCSIGSVGTSEEVCSSQGSRAQVPESGNVGLRVTVPVSMP